MELSILIATVPSQRPGLLSRLLARLESQVREDGHAEVVVHQSETKTMGQKFNELYQAAHGRLSVQVDDDDLVVEDYVTQILAISEGHDFVGYQVNVTLYGLYLATYEIDPPRAKVLREYHFKDLVRHVTPKCPIDTKRARAVLFGEGYGADWYWSQELVQNGYPRDPVFIPRSLYWYDCWPDHTLGTCREEWMPQRQVSVQDYDPSTFRWIS